MKKNTEINNDEIHLVELLSIVWKGKFKILVATLITVLSLMLYIKTQPKNFIAKTNVVPISTIEENKYTSFNSFEFTSIEEILNPIKNTEDTKFIINTSKDKDDDAYPILNKDLLKFDQLKTFKITSEGLLNHYVNLLNEKKLFEDGIRKYKLLDINNYSNVNDYEEAISKLSSSIKIIYKINIPEKEQIQQGFEVKYINIQFEFDDSEKWKLVLKYVDENANLILKDTLYKQYQRLLSTERQKREYLLEDIVEKIKYLKIDYDTEATNKISYLEEQSAIAKQLGIAKNTIEVQTLVGNQNKLLSTVSTESPFYLRGYEAIDKEIELIKSRKNKSAFIDGLAESLTFKRKIELDKAIDRVELIFKKTPLAKNEKFYAASLNVLSTNFDYKNYRKQIMISVIFGLIFGLLFVLFSHAIQTQKNS